ncbi:MAG: thioredoxin domain-containing protein [Chloroflexota bacterium]
MMSKSSSQAARSVKGRSQQKNQRATLISVVGIVAVVFVALLLFLLQQANQTSHTIVNPGKYAQIPQTTTSDGMPVLGSPDAKVTVMEFADFSCPHCLEYLPTTEQLIEKYVQTGKVRFVYSPLTFVGGTFSEIAAQAALCAGKQNAFWEMHDAIFSLQQTGGYQSFQVEILKNVANNLNLNGDALGKCVANGETEATLKAAADLGNKLGVNGTPSMLYSTDGQNYMWWNGVSANDHIIPQFDMISEVLNKIVS